MFPSTVNPINLEQRFKEMILLYPAFQRHVHQTEGGDKKMLWIDKPLDWSQQMSRITSQAELDSWLSVAPSFPVDLPLWRTATVLLPGTAEVAFIVDWHHVVTDFESMFNLLAAHLFGDTQRTELGYQLAESKAALTPKEMGLDGFAPANVWLLVSSLFSYYFSPAKNPGLNGIGYDSRPRTLPYSLSSLRSLGSSSHLPLSDVLSLVALRTVERLHARDPQKRPAPPDVLSPLSLRENAASKLTGNQRALKRFDIDTEGSVADSYHRVLSSRVVGSYKGAGNALKRVGTLARAALLSSLYPSYISNYFPMADHELFFEGQPLKRYNLRVPMVPCERTKFAWSSYRDDVILFLQLDPVLQPDAAIVEESFDQALSEVVQFLGSLSAAAPEATLKSEF